MSSSNTAVEEREDVDVLPLPQDHPLLVKVVLVGLVDALLIISFAKTVSDEWWLAAAFFVLVFVGRQLRLLHQRGPCP